MKRKALSYGAVVLAGLAAGLFWGLKFHRLSYAQDQNLGAPSFEGIGIEDAVINVAGAAGKAVVSISTEHVAKQKSSRSYYYNIPEGSSPFGDDEFFRRFFEDFFGEAPQFGGRPIPMPDIQERRFALGSGVIIDAEGYILTNEHVINDADKITVKLPDGREFKGETKGTDPRSDLAVIKINAHNLPVAALGDSDNLKIGQWVVAIGNPFSFAMQNSEPTVTVGVIGALHRSLGKTLSRNRDYNDLIQTDAAINPGNSGGPLVNLKGEVVGINVAIFSTSGGYQGIGFAIPISNAKRIIAGLLKGKRISYGWLGVTVQDLNENLAKHFGLSDKGGALISKVLEKGPASKAGIKEGDIIRQLDNYPVNNVRELLGIVGKTEVGRKVKVTVMRERKEITLEAEIAERPQDQDLEKTSPEPRPAPNKWRGLEVENLAPEDDRRGKTEEANGVVVTNVEPYSPADDAGVIPGDIIIEINKTPVNNLSDYNRNIKTIRGDALIRSNRGYFLLKPGE